MTPQGVRTALHAHPRMSTGAGILGPATVGARRVRLVEPWKVTDLVIPMEQIKDEDEDQAGLGSRASSPQKARGVTSERKKLSDEERRVSTVLSYCRYSTLIIYFTVDRLSLREDDPRSQRQTTSSRVHVEHRSSLPVPQRPFLLSSLEPQRRRTPISTVRPPLQQMPNPMRLQRKTQACFSRA